MSPTSEGDGTLFLFVRLQHARYILSDRQSRILNVRPVIGTITIDVVDHLGCLLSPPSRHQPTFRSSAVPFLAKKEAIEAFHRVDKLACGTRGQERARFLALDERIEDLKARLDNALSESIVRRLLIHSEKSVPPIAMRAELVVLSFSSLLDGSNRRTGMYLDDEAYTGIGDYPRESGKSPKDLVGHAYTYDGPLAQEKRCNHPVADFY